MGLKIFGKTERKTPFGLHISPFFRTFILLKVNEKDGLRTGIIAAQAAEIERLRNKVDSLEDQLYWLRKKMFGKMS